MKGEINLYIGGMEVDLSKDVKVLFTYSADEVTNPTVVKNSYTKTITLEDSPTNSKIFGQFWNLERMQNTDGDIGTSFNPSKRVPFELYVNGEVYQSGYCKLNNIKKTKKHNIYEINLFGGLGSFFYNLAYAGNDSGDDSKRKLSDLHFMTWDTTTPSEREFDFAITKETVKEAWDYVQHSISSKWHYINFASCYDGLPSDFSSDRVLVNYGTGDTTTKPSSGSARRPGGSGANFKMPAQTSTTEATFATYDGYALATMNDQHTGPEMREFRSYLMRPVIRVKEVINACCEPENNGGFNVELDSSFFNSENPYWEEAWMTLPSLKTMDFGGVVGDEQTGITATIGSSSSGGSRNGNLYKETTNITIGTITANTTFSITLDLDIQAILGTLPSGYVTQDTNFVYNGLYPQAMSPAAIYPCAYSMQSNTVYPGAIEVQLVAYSVDGRVITGTELYNCTSGYNPYRDSRGRGTVYVPSPNDFTQFEAEYNGGYTTKDGSFQYVSGSTWQMGKTMSFNLKNLPKTCTLKLIITKLNGTSQSYSDKAMCLFQRYYGDYTVDSTNHLTSSYSTYYRQPAKIQNFKLVIKNVAISLASTDESIRSGAKFTKQSLLNTNYTPCDFLLSYCKMFGLYFEKDKYEDTIYIRTRSSYYNQDKVVDLSSMIDKSKTTQITPIVFDAKWYNWQLEQEDSLFGQQYEANYGQPYGIQRINTGYNFDATEKDLYEDSIFKGTVEALEKSEMYSYVSGDTNSKPWMFDGFKYNLYNTQDLEDTIEMTMAPMPKIGVLTSFSQYKYYDLYDKMQFHTDENNPSDGSLVLCFFNGFAETKTLDSDTSLNYYITDDNSYMMTLNDNKPCWIYTTSETDKNGNSIAIKVNRIPLFSRYLSNHGTGYIKQSWDFGAPKQLYLPGYNIDYPSSIYYNYWRSYISDMYDVNTKKLTCYVNFERRPAEDWLRDFYWFDNSIWRINKISDFNIMNNESTKVEFIKVQDRENYSNVNVSSIPTITLSASTTAITNAGGSITIYVSPSDAGNWYVGEYTYYALSASTSHGVGNGSFTINVPPNTGDTGVVWNVSAENDYDRVFFIQILQGNSIFSVTPTGTYAVDDVPWTGDTCVYNVKSSHSWSVTADKNYVTISPSSGTASAVYGTDVSVTFAESDSLAARNVKLVFSDTEGNTETVYKWQGQRETLVFPYTGSTQVIEYLSGASAVTPAWIEVTDNGNNTYNVKAIRNPELSSRTSTLYFSFSGSTDSSNVDVLQYAGGVFDVTRIDGGGSVLQAGGQVQLAITSNNNWTATNNDSWVTMSPVSGSTSTTFTAVFAKNEGENRITTIRFNHISGITVDFTVTQIGLVYDDFVDPVYMLFDGTGGTQNITITSTSDAWRVVGRPSWISVSTTAGTGNGTIAVTASPSTDVESRTGSIVIWNQTRDKTYVVTVNQGIGNVFKVTRTNGTGDILTSGGTAVLEVTSPEKSWTVSTSDAFVTLSKTASTTTDSLNVVFGENTGETRSATLVFTNADNQQITYTQTQAGTSVTSKVNPTMLVFEATGGTSAVTVNINNTWNIVARSPWLSTSINSATTSAVFTVTASPYSGSEQRNGVIVVYDTVTTKAYQVLVIQNAVTGEILAVNPSSIAFSVDGGTAQLAIISNTDWTIG